MTDKRQVTEADFRIPELRDAKVEDYEFRDDGSLVRKDRWERAVHSVARMLDMNGRGGFEIDDVLVSLERVLRGGSLTEDGARWAFCVRQLVESKCWPIVRTDGGIGYIESQIDAMRAE